MIARRLVLSLALAALVSNCLVLGKPSAGTGPEGSQAFTLVSLKHQTVGALTRILIESNAPPLYTVLRPTDRLVVVELPGGDAAQLAPEYAVKSALVDSIVVRKTNGGKAPAARAATRIEIAVNQDARDRSVLDGNTLVIELSTDQPTAKEAVQRPGVYVEPVPVGSKKTASATDRAPSQPTSLKPATAVRNVRSEGADAGLLVFVEADGVLQFKEFMLPDPWRIVVDITGVRSSFGNKTLQIGAAGIDRVRVGQPESNMVRVVLDAKSKVSYRITREPGQLVIAVGDVTAAQAKATSAPETTSTAKSREGETPAQQVETSKDSSEQSGIPGDLIAQDGKPTLPAKSATRERTATTKPAASSGKETITQQAPASGGKTVAELQRGASSQPQQITGSPAASPLAPQAQPAARPQPGPSFCDDNYVGGLISFDLRAGVDLRDMLRFIAQQYGINFIIDKSVGPVPIDIKINDRPWNEILNAVLRANRLGALCEGDGGIIRIAALAAVKEQRELEKWALEARVMVVPTETKIIRLRYARVGGNLGGTGTGRTGSSQASQASSFAAGGGASNQGGTRGGSVAGIQGGGLLQIIGRRLSQRGVIEIDVRTNSLIITDIPEYIQAAEAIVAQLDRPDPQVEIEARIVIASRNFLRDLGVELGAGAINSHRGTAGLFATSPVTLSPTGVQSTSGGGSGGATTGIGPNLVGPKADGTLRGAANSVLSLTTGLVGTGILSTALSASETKGQVRTIASPRITASNNETAEIVNGVQIPVQTVSNNTVTTTFVTAALRLEITPQIIEDTGEVLMHVTAENNTVNLAINPGGTPGINTQSADTTVRIMDGGTTVMGGINIDGESHSQNRTPGVSRVPILGELFKRRTTSRNYDEILFFITPRIVKPDGWGGPKSLAPQRSSLEGIPSPGNTQKAAVPMNPSDPKTQKVTQPVQAKAGQ